jgi:hypothetical protein
LVAAIAKRSKVLDGRAVSYAKYNLEHFSNSERRREALRTAEAAHRTALDVEAMDDLGEQQWCFIARVDADTPVRSMG